MKCDFCGGNISLEDKFCPYCGAPNKQAEKHYADMENYKKRFNRTQQEVFRATRRSSVLTSRIAVLCVLIVLIIILIAVDMRVYSILRVITNQKADRNMSQYKEQIEECLKEEDYLSLAVFSEENNLLWNDGYEEYVMVMRSARNYQDCVSYLIDLSSAEDLENAVRKAANFADSLTYFYRAANLQQYENYPEEVFSSDKLQAVDNMKESLQGMISAQLEIPMDELDDLPQMTEGKRAVLIEDALTKLMEGGDGGDE